jgi:hypothetical protein
MIARSIRTTALLLSLLVAVATAQTSRIEKNAITGYESIQANDLRAHLMFLASPELEGRETTFRGQKIAAQYIASVYRKLGLKTLSGADSYLQSYNLEVSRISNESKITLHSKPATTAFELRKDFIPTSVRDTTVTAPIVLIGYADQSLDSIAMENLKGKVVMTFAGRRTSARDTTIPRMRRFFSFRQFPGTLATLMVLDEKHQTKIEEVSRMFGDLDKGTMRLPGSSTTRGFGGNTLIVSSRLANEIVRSTGTTIDELRETAYADSLFKPVDLKPSSVTIELRVIREIKTAENVVGLIEGSDPRVKNEAVVFTAHYDHLGVGGDGSIYHGADDDGSGTSVLLELAEAFSMNPTKPKRSVLFLAVSGEEKGLLGSAYYVQNPLIPLEKTVANINMDMVGRVDEKYQQQKIENYTYVIGSDKISTDLDSLLNVANKESENLTLDYTYNDESDPNQFYRRSDHFNFARNGIPVVFFFTGIHEDYHRPTDTVDKILFDKTARIGRLSYYLGWKVANSKSGLRKNVDISSN